MLKIIRVKNDAKKIQVHKTDVKKIFSHKSTHIVPMYWNLTLMKTEKLFLGALAVYVRMGILFVLKILTLNSLFL